MCRFRHPCRNLAKSLKDEEIGLKAGRTAAGNKAKDELRHFMCGLVLLMKQCVRNHIARLWVSDTNRSSMVVEMFFSVEG